MMPEWEKRLIEHKKRIAKTVDEIVYYLRENRILFVRKDNEIEILNPKRFFEIFYSPEVSYEFLPPIDVDVRNETICFYVYGTHQLCFDVYFDKIKSIILIPYDNETYLGIIFKNGDLIEFDYEGFLNRMETKNVRYEA